MTRLIAVVTRLSQSASRTTGEASATASDPSRIARTTSVRTGSPRNRAKRAASAASERSPQRPAVRGSGLERPAQPAPPRAPGCRLDHDGGGRNPKPARIAWPSGPANQARKACGRGGVRGRLDDDAGVGREHVRRVGHVDGRDLRRGLGVGDVDDARVALAELDLGDHRLDVVLLGHDVGRVGGGEVGGIAGLLGEVVDELRRVLGDRHLVAGGDDLDAGLGEVGGRRDPGRVVGRDDHRQLVAGEGRPPARRSGPCRRAPAGSSCPPRGRRRPGRPARSSSARADEASVEIVSVAPGTAAS